MNFRPIISTLSGEVVPAFPLAITCVSREIREPDRCLDWFRNSYEGNFHPLTGLGFEADFPIRYIGGISSFSRVKVEDIIHAERPLLLENKILIIGVVDKVFNDSYRVSANFSTDRLLPGAVITANAINTLLKNNSLRAIPHWAELLIGTSVGLLSFIAGFAQRRSLILAVLLTTLYGVVELLARYSNTFVLLTPLIFQVVALRSAAELFRPRRNEGVSLPRV